MTECYSWAFARSEVGRALLAGESEDTFALMGFHATPEEHLAWQQRCMVQWNTPGIFRIVVSRYRLTDDTNSKGARRLEHIEVVGLYDVTQSGWTAIPRKPNEPTRGAA